MEPKPGPYYIFLDPDGTQDFGLMVIVKAETGVVYAHQCGGLHTILCNIEGFAVPLGGPQAAEPLRRFFRVHFRGNPPIAREDEATSENPAWTVTLLAELDTVVAQVAFWKTYAPNESTNDQRAFLRLDLSKSNELTEAWIPVQTPYGPGVLVFANSD